ASGAAVLLLQWQLGRNRATARTTTAGSARITSNLHPAVHRLRLLFAEVSCLRRAKQRSVSRSDHVRFFRAAPAMRSRVHAGFADRGPRTLSPRANTLSRVRFACTPPR